MDKPSLDMIERLDELERALRRIAWIGAAVFVGSVVLLAEATDLLRPPREFAIRDRAGRVRARLALVGDDAELAFYDPQGDPQFRIQGTANGAASLSLLERGRVRMNLAASEEGPASLSLFDTAEVPRGRSTLFMGADGTTGLDLRNDRLAVVTAVQPDGLGGLYVADQDGAERGRVGALPAGVTCPSLAPVGIGGPLFSHPSLGGTPHDPDRL
jgi:hypothetical protein